MKNVEWLLVITGLCGITEQETPLLHQTLLKIIDHTEDESSDLETAKKILELSGITSISHPLVHGKITATAYDATNLANVFKSLPNSGDILQRYKHIYETILGTYYFLDGLAIAFQSLKNAGASLEKHELLYQVVMKNIENAKVIGTNITSLANLGANPQQHMEFFKAILKNCYKIQNLMLAFKLVSTINIKDNYACESFYQAIIENSETIEKISSSVYIFQAMGFSIEKNPWAYIGIIRNVQNTKAIFTAFEILSSIGASFEKNERLYNKVVAGSNYAKTFSAGFLALSSVGATPMEHEALYSAITDMNDPYSYSNDLATALKLLANMGADFNTHEDLYQRIIIKSDKATKLAIIFEVLFNTGARVTEHEEIFLEIIMKAREADKLAQAFQALSQAGATLIQHTSLYFNTIDKSDYGEKLAIGFKALSDAGATISKHELFYQLAIAHAYSSDYINEAFSQLKKINASLEQHAALYQTAIKHAYCAHQIGKVFLALKDIGATLEHHITLYQAAIENIIYTVDKIKEGLLLLSSIGATLKNHLAIYKDIIESIENLDKIKQIFEALSRIGITLNAHPTLYRLAIRHLENNIIDNIHLIPQLGFNTNNTIHAKMLENILKTLTPDSTILSWLKQHELRVDSHPYIYEAFFLGAKSVVYKPLTLFKVQNLLDTFFAGEKILHSTDTRYQVQCDEVMRIINNEITDDTALTEGPLNISEATLSFEKMLRRIANIEVSQLNITYDESLGYLLKIQDEPYIYLNELLKLVNFNHLTLDNNCIDKIGKMLKKITLDFDCSIDAPTAIINQLPEAAIKALGCYTSNNRYKNINRLFRGIHQTSEDSHVWIHPVTGKNNLLANFLCGCLINWAANQLPLLQAHLKEDTLFDGYNFMDRGENLDKAEEDGHLGVREARQANPVHTASVLSVSIFPTGSPYFHEAGTERSIFERDKNRPPISKNEGEVLITQGTTLRYEANPLGGFFVREINSPGIVPNGGYWSSIALAEAYKQYLSTPYKETSNTVTINAKTVQRPNHGLAHEYRVMTYIDIVIDHFANYATDPAFKLFCQYITFQEREWLRVAAAYSITGRESEISAGENLTRYNEFREASLKHILLFLDKYPPLVEDQAMRDRMLHLVRWMGNPAYENNINGKSAINDHEDLDERCHRNFLYRILTIAHKLDLPRCYTPMDFEKALSLCRDLSISSPEQTTSYIRMMQYAINLIRAHGNALCTQMGATGALLPCQETYRTPFELVSTNLRQLREMTDTVSRPKLTEGYQFNDNEDETLRDGILKMCGIGPVRTTFRHQDT